MGTRNWVVGVLLVAVSASVYAQNHAAELSSAQLISQPGPTFTYADNELPSPLTFIAYGDTRFTDPANVTATDPAVRQWLVKKIASEAPAAILMSGDVPLSGSSKDDYAVFQTETQAWRDAHLRVFPALGNHEFRGADAQQCLENWWNAFPQLRQRRWYSIALGSRVYATALDSNDSLLPNSDQTRWLVKQIQDLPKAVDFLVVTLHHPPVADIQTNLEPDPNPRPNEIALRDYLSKIAGQTHARIIINSGHIHNYERHLLDEVTYLVSGGGGARPHPVERTKDDLYQSSGFPNYHYVKFTLQADRLHAIMYRIADPEAAAYTFEPRDTFDIKAKDR